MVFIVAVRVGFTVARAARDFRGGVADDELVFGIIGVADETSGVLGLGLGGPAGRYVVAFGRLIQQQGGVRINDQRGQLVCGVLATATDHGYCAGDAEKDQEYGNKSTHILYLYWFSVNRTNPLCC